MATAGHHPLLPPPVLRHDRACRSERDPQLITDQPWQTGHRRGRNFQVLRRMCGPESVGGTVEPPQPVEVVGDLLSHDGRPRAGSGHLDSGSVDRQDRPAPPALAIGSTLGAARSGRCRDARCAHVGNTGDLPEELVHVVPQHLVACASNSSGREASVNRCPDPAYSWNSALAPDARTPARNWSIQAGCGSDPRRRGAVAPTPPTARRQRRGRAGAARRRTARPPPRAGAGRRARPWPAPLEKPATTRPSDSSAVASRAACISAGSPTCSA